MEIELVGNILGKIKIADQQTITCTGCLWWNFSKSHQN